MKSSIRIFKLKLVCLPECITLTSTWNCTARNTASGKNKIIPKMGLVFKISQRRNFDCSLSSIAYLLAPTLFKETIFDDGKFSF